jgi:hypothetical protein
MSVAKKKKKKKIFAAQKHPFSFEERDVFRENK